MPPPKATVSGKGQSKDKGQAKDYDTKLRDRSFREQFGYTLWPTDERFYWHCRESGRSAETPLHEHIARLQKRKPFMDAIYAFTAQYGDGVKAPYTAQQLLPLQELVAQIAKGTSADDKKDEEDGSMELEDRLGA